VAETNMPTPDIMNLVNVSTEGESWDIQKISLLGTGSTGLPSYGMPGSSLYMYVPDEESVLEIKEEITNILETQ
ncbi:MAG: LytR family transcriptional regulator, partial [Clostridiaceae bacterium]|nr:LytR family transcriptional regulator [Clostridiaceae bacterium]